MRPLARLAVLLPLLAACDGGPLEPGAFTLDGTWRGRGFPYELALDLDQDGANDVRGTGEVRSLREVLETDTVTLDPLVVDTLVIDTVVQAALPVQVRGDWDFPDVSLVLRAEGYADAAYTGRFADPDTVAGNLAGSGLPSTTIRLVRQGVGE